MVITRVSLCVVCRESTVRDPLSSGRTRVSAGPARRVGPPRHARVGPRVVGADRDRSRSVQVVGRSSIVYANEVLIPSKNPRGRGGHVSMCDAQSYMGVWWCFVRASFHAHRPRDLPVARPRRRRRFCARAAVRRPRARVTWTEGRRRCLPCE